MPTPTPTKGGPCELKEKELDKVAAGMRVVIVNNNTVDNDTIDYNNVPDGTLAVHVKNKQRQYREGQLPS